MSEPRTYYVTTPIYYVNDVPHIGHMYTTLACDVLARFRRLDGYRVRFLTGTDEHGQKVQKAAALAGVTPQAFADRVSGNFFDLAAAMRFSNDDFIRTTEHRHMRGCQALWQRLIERDQIYLGSYSGWYAVRDEAFYAESELTRGPDGTRLAPSGAPVEWVEEPSYFFRLSAWQDRLLELYAQHPDFVLPDVRRNEVVSFVSSGLQDLSISRTTFDWGVPVPGHPDHVMYVWLDALTNYISALGYPDTGGDFADFWPADVHVVGKDILRFHAVYWPAFLMAADLPVPKRVFAHGWWTNEGQKISKSLGNVIDPDRLVADYGLDAVRYFMLREVPFGSDGDFSHRAIVGRINGDLANDLGNLAQRVLSMVAKRLKGLTPTPGPFSEDDQALLDASVEVVDRCRRHLDGQMFHLALTALWEVVAQANVYIDRQAPWKLAKSDINRMSTVLYVVMAVIQRIALVLQAFMPDAASRLLDQIGINPNARTLAALTDAPALVPGRPLPAPEGVFPRYLEPSPKEA